jgi:hypothetical protein
VNGFFVLVIAVLIGCVVMMTKGDAEKADTLTPSFVAKRGFTNSARVVFVIAAFFVFLWATSWMVQE